MRFSTFAVSMLAGSAAAKKTCPSQKIVTEIVTFTVTGGAAPSSTFEETSTEAVFPTSVVPSDTPIENPVKPTTTSAPAQPTTTSESSQAPVETTSSTSTTAAAQPSSTLSTDQQSALDAHNQARADVGVAPLEWDADLEASALAWAKKLVPLGGTLEHSQSGENLAWQMQTGGNFVNPLSIGTKMWLDEKKDYNGGAIDTSTDAAYQYFEKIGHYTQCVWNTTTKVGIAAVEQGEDVWIVAHYDPAGNVGGATPY